MGLTITRPPPCPVNGPHHPIERTVKQVSRNACKQRASEAPERNPSHVIQAQAATQRLPRSREGMLALLNTPGGAATLSKRAPAVLRHCLLGRLPQARWPSYVQ